MLIQKETQLETANQDLEFANRDLETARKDLEISNKDLENAYKELEAANKNLEKELAAFHNVPTSNIFPAEGISAIKEPPNVDEFLNKINTLEQ